MGGRFSATFLGHPRQHLAVRVVGVAPCDRAHCRIGFHGRAVHGDPFGLQELMICPKPQNPAKDLVMNLVRQLVTGLRHPAVVEDFLRRCRPQELAQQ